MGAAATEHGLSVAYGTPAGPADILAALEVPAVTFFFASPNPNLPQARWTNWHIARMSLLLSVIGIVPMKDCFWTSVQESKDPYGGIVWPNPELHALTATLSNGPMWVGDAVGRLNASVLYPSIRVNDSRILRPHAPCGALDPMFDGSWGGSDGGELCGTFSAPAPVEQDDAQANGWPIVLAVDTAHSASVFLGMAGTPGRASCDYIVSAMGPAADAAARGNNASAFVLKAGQPLDIPQLREGGESSSNPNRTARWALMRMAPVQTSGWALLGETSAKYVAVSRQRFSNLATMDGALSVSVTMGSFEPSVDVYAALSRDALVVVKASCAGGSGEEVARVFRCEVIDGDEPISVRCSCA